MQNFPEKVIVIGLQPCVVRSLLDLIQSHA